MHKKVSRRNVSRRNVSRRNVSRRNKKGGIFGFDNISGDAQSVGSRINDGVKSVGSSIGDGFSYLYSFLPRTSQSSDNMSQPSGYPPQQQSMSGYPPQQQSMSGYPPQQQSMGGRKKNKKGGAPAVPYSAKIWLNQSPYPQSVGGRRRKSRRNKK